MEDLYNANFQGTKKKIKTITKMERPPRINIVKIGSLLDAIYIFKLQCKSSHNLKKKKT